MFPELLAYPVVYLCVRTNTTVGNVREAGHARFHLHYANYDRVCGLLQERAVAFIISSYANHVIHTRQQLSSHMYRICICIYTYVHLCAVFGRTKGPFLIF